MRYLSVCSGIEAATVAWHPLGWSPVAFAEIERFPCAVLAHHYPSVSNWRDLTRFRDWPDATLDLLVGGTPCQSFSIAGLRKGLDDPRGSLLLAYLAVARRYRPVWVVWENVPGVLSIDDGRAFGALLGGLAELGYGFAYRVFDAQYFGLAQRRARVFVVGHLGDWRRAAAVLFERESLSGHPSPSRETWEDIAGSLAARATAGGGLGTDFDCDGGLICADVAPTLNAHFGEKQGLEDQHINGGAGLFIAHSLRADGFDASEDGTGRGTPIVPIDLRQASRGEKVTNNRAHGSGGPCGHGVGNDGDPAFTVSERGQAVAFAENQRGELVTSDTMGALKAGGGKPGQGYPAVAFADLADPVAANQGRTYTREGAHNFRVSNVAIQTMRVRRLTPRECERLQGFPDDYTLVPYRGKPAADGPRYKALGNSMAVPVMRWIGQRIALVEQVLNETEPAVTGSA